MDFRWGVESRRMVHRLGLKGVTGREVKDYDSEKGVCVCVLLKGILCANVG